MREGIGTSAVDYVSGLGLCGLCGVGFCVCHFGGGCALRCCDACDGEVWWDGWNGNLNEGHDFEAGHLALVEGAGNHFLINFSSSSSITIPVLHTSLSSFKYLSYAC